MSASVVTFPLYRRQTLLSRIAHALRVKHGEEARLFWRETAGDLLSQLTESGVGPGMAEEEVRNLLYAALAEIEKDTTSVGG
jgi:hypothetical protein